MFRPISKLNYKKVLLIDDVKSTGATLNECTKELLFAGCEEVYSAVAVANVLGIELEIPETEQGPGMGAAMLSMVACGNKKKGPVEVKDPTYTAGQIVELNVYNWGEYISDGADGAIDVNREFEKLTGIKVNYTTFESNETMYSQLENGGVSYDIVIPSDYMIERLIKEKMLSTIDVSRLSNFKYIKEETARKYSNASDYPHDRYTKHHLDASCRYFYKSVHNINGTSYDTEHKRRYQRLSAICYGRENRRHVCRRWPYRQCYNNGNRTCSANDI